MPKSGGRFKIREGKGRGACWKRTAIMPWLTGHVIIRVHHGFFCTNSVLTCVAQYNKARRPRPATATELETATFHPIVCPLTDRHSILVGVWLGAER